MYTELSGLKMLGFSNLGLAIKVFQFLPGKNEENIDYLLRHFDVPDFAIQKLTKKGQQKSEKKRFTY